MIIENTITGEKVNCLQYGWWLTYLDKVAMGRITYEEAWEEMKKDNERYIAKLENKRFKHV